MRHKAEPGYREMEIVTLRPTFKELLVRYQYFFATLIIIATSYGFYVSGTYVGRSDAQEDRITVLRQANEYARLAVYSASREAGKLREARESQNCFTGPLHLQGVEVDVRPEGTWIRPGSTHIHTVFDEGAKP